MAYTRINWENTPSTNTPINATNLNVMDAGIKENDDKLLGNKSMGSIVVEDVIGKNILNFKDSGYWGIRNTSSGVIFPNNLAVNTAKNTNTRFFKKIPVGTTLTVSARVIEGIDSFESGWTQIGISLNYIDGTDERKLLTIQSGNKTVIQYITFTTEKEVESIDMAHGCNIVVSNSSRVVVGLMLEKGTQATSYTPYKNFNAPYFQDLTNEIVYNSSMSSATKTFTLYKYGNIFQLVGHITDVAITANSTIFTIPVKYLSGITEGLRFVFIGGSATQIYVIINADGSFVSKTNTNWLGGSCTWIIKDDVSSTSTQTASTMSLRPDTTEKGEIDE